MTSDTQRPPSGEPPSPAVTVLGWLVALWCLGFAAVNIGYEFTGRFGTGEYAAYGVGFSVMNWLVVSLKVLGAVVAFLSIGRPSRFLSPPIVNVLVWGAFAAIGVYALGSVVEAIGLATGLTGSSDQVTLAGLGYVAFFLLGAAAYGVLAVSNSRRLGVGRGWAYLGLLGAPVVLGLVLVGVPTLLSSAGLLPKS